MLRMFCRRLSRFAHLNRMDARTWNIVQLGIAFMFIFSAFNTQGFIEEIILNSVSAERNITDISQHAGYYSLSIIYAVFTMSNFVAPPLIGVFGTKWAMILGAACYCVFMLGFLRLTSWFLYFSSALLGFGAAVLWTGQGNYMTLNSTDETIGQNSGLLWAMLQSCLIVGAVFLFWVGPFTSSLTESSVRLIYSCFSTICALGLLTLTLLRSPDNQLSIVDQQKNDTDALVESFSSHNQQVVDSVTNISHVESAPKSSFDNFVGTFKLMGTRNMLLLAVVFMYSGVELTFWTSIYSTCLAFTNKFNADTYTLLALNSLMLGFGQILGINWDDSLLIQLLNAVGSGCLFGLFSHRTGSQGRNPIILIGAVVHLICFFLVFLHVPMDAPLTRTNGVAWMHPSYVLALLCAWLLGFGDSCWNTQIYSILGFLYPVNSASAFALYKFFQSLAACASFYYGSTLLLHWQLLILSIGAVLGALCYFPVEWEAHSMVRIVKQP